MAQSEFVEVTNTRASLVWGPTVPPEKGSRTPAKRICFLPGKRTTITRRELALCEKNPSVSGWIALGILQVHEHASNAPARPVKTRIPRRLEGDNPDIRKVSDVALLTIEQCVSAFKREKASETPRQDIIDALLLRGQNMLDETPAAETETETEETETENED